MQVVISCMDYRLTQEVINKSKKDSLIIRNAGANVFEIKEILKKLNPKEVVYLPHSDCAAMKLTYSVIKNHEGVTQLINDKLISVFKDKNFSSLKELEEINAKVNEDLLKEILPKAKITTELVDVNKIKWPERKARFYVLKSNTKYDEEMIGSYIIQSPELEVILADLEIANKLGLRIENNEFDTKF